MSLVIDNRSRKLDFDADDVKVTRRYYRSGESEYLINNATVRLKDVQMLFMDTGLGRDGYSIIGQGRIGDIVASKSEERREIFEEAAGISKYRYRKNEAERRLKSTEENLLRLRDILQELEERVGPLAQQAEKAKKFLEYAGEKKDLEIGLWLHTMIDSRAVLRELSAKLELARTPYEAAGEAMDGFEAQMEDIARRPRSWPWRWTTSAGAPSSWRRRPPAATGTWRCCATIFTTTRRTRPASERKSACRRRGTAASRRTSPPAGGHPR